MAAASLLALLYSVFKDYLAGLVRAFDTAIRQYLREVGYKERLGFQEEFEEDFRRIIDVVTNERQRSLVVFIDDLDRCAPPKAAEIIEAISFLPRAQNCAFVMAMDCKLVAASIEGKYKDLAGYLTDVNEPCSPTFGQRFLEKIIQVHFHIPRAEAKTMREFVESILNEIDSEAKPPTGIAGTAGGGPPESIAVAWATQMTRTHFLVPRPETKPPTSGTDVPVPGPSDTSGGIGAEPEPQTEAKLKQESFVDSFDEHQGVRDALAWAAPYLQFSPRRITRFINTFRLLALIANRSGLLENGRIELLPLAQWAVIATRWPAVIEGLLADTHFVEQLTEARNLLTIWRPESIHGPDPVTAEAAKAAKVEFEANLYFMSPRIKQLISEHDLFWVLKELGQALDDKERMSSYLRLAQMVHTSVRYQPTPILPQIGAES